MKKKQRILGIDPGSRSTGFGIVDTIDSETVYVASGSVKSIEGSFVDRLHQIYRSIEKIFDEYIPNVMVVENIFIHKNPSSALKLGHARSAAICASFNYKVSFAEYAPREIKQAVVGTGSATKEQVQHMVTSLLKLNGTPSPDAADALATAICYVNHQKFSQHIASKKIVTDLS